MRKKHFKTSMLAVLLAAGCLCCTAGLTAAAITVDDVAQKAREVGFPEEQVQLGYNMWATGEYTQADLEEAYAMLCEYDTDANDKIDSIFDTGATGTTTPPATEPDRTGDVTPSGNTSSAGSSDNSTVTPPSQSTSSAADSASGSANSNAGGTAGGNTSSAAPSAPSESKPSGTVTSTDFILMTLDEKIAYVNSMSPEDKENFLNNLTPAERNSIIKQMNIDDQAELLQGYINVAEKMNMNISVDSISSEGIAITVRDNEGTIVDKSATGITIDETGISHTGLLAAAAAAILLCAAGFAGLYRYICKTDEQAQ